MLIIFCKDAGCGAIHKTVCFISNIIPFVGLQSGDRESLSRINASMQAVVHSQPKVPQKRLRFDDCDVTESPPILTNGNSKDDGSEPEVNGTNGRKEHEAQETEAS